MEQQVPTRSSTARAWMQLFRPPNLLTVPGDPLAGFLLARMAVGRMPAISALPCLFASLFLYMAGLLSNDYFDLEEDKKERPDRPLPSGAVSPRAALTVAVLLAVLGIGAAFMAGPVPAVVAAVLACTIAIYNIWMKKVEILGPVVMGICRGLSIMLGAAAFGMDGIFCTIVLMAAAGVAFYISAVTGIAAHETHGVEIGGNRWRPLTSLVMCLFFIMFSVESLAPSKLTPHANPLEFYMMAVAGLMALFWALYCGSQLEGEPEPAVVSRTIGGFLRGLLFVQAAFAALAGGRAGLLSAAALLLLWPLAGILGRRFYAS